MIAPLAFPQEWNRSHGREEPWQRLEAAWDHLAVECAAASVPGLQLVTAALIESGAGGRRVAREPAPKAYVVMAQVSA
jgi:hypothetical protein